MWLGINKLLTFLLTVARWRVVMVTGFTYSRSLLKSKIYLKVQTNRI